MKTPILLLAAGLLSLGTAQADTIYFDVTVTNVTRGQAFTPLIVATHKSSIAFFEAGAEASPELAAIAEGGDTSSLAALLASVPDQVFGIGFGTGLIGPGGSETVRVAAKSGFGRVSVAGMLLPTNDTFMSVNSALLPRGNKATSVAAIAYDAGSEPNDEDCANIPGGADCAGQGGSPDAGGEGSVHVSAGIHGIGSLAPSAYDWRNPVARVTIQRVQ